MTLHLVLFFLVPAGIILALAAVWLTTRRGNTISEILNSQQFKETEAVKIEIVDKIKLSTNIPIVAMYIIAAIVICLPLSIVLMPAKSNNTCINISGKIITADTNSNVMVKMTSYIPSKELTPGVEFNIPILIGQYIDKPAINFESDNYERVTIGVNIRDNNIVLSSNDLNWGVNGEKKWHIDEDDINLDRIVLHRLEIAQN